MEVDVSDNSIKKCKRQIFLFVFLTYLIPFVCIFLMKYTTLGQIDYVHFILFGIEGASPTIAAIIIIFMFEKISGMKKFLHSNFSPKIKISHLISCVVIAFTIMSISKVVSCLILKTPFEMAKLTSRQIIIIAWAFVSEEIGWRGFLTKKFETFLSPVVVPLLVGLIWAFWHYHFYIIGSIDVNILLFIMGCIVDSYLYFALLKIAGGNILIAMVYHMTSNLCINLFLINPNMNARSSIPYTFYILISGVFVIAILTFLKYRKIDQHSKH